ncbi:MAG: recombinase family protein [Desulfobacteraceae bacterium]|nr:recombinase family protein [Desulfobacteraceae bacterium]
MKSAAIYARVSSDRQKEDQTIASQTAALIEYSQQEGYAVPSEWVFQDEGYSGATLIRPGLEEVRDLAAEGQIETILIYSPDRLSRKYAYQVLIVDEFSRHGVEVIFIKSPQASTPEEQLLLQFQGMISEYERAQVTERTRRGKRYRAKSGLINVLSGAPYGFRYVKKTESTAAYYEIIEEEADIVRKVFKMYTGVNRLSIGAVVRWLNDHEIPTRKKTSRWERSTIWAMLRNPAYVGRACFGKTESTPRQRITRPLRNQGGFSPRCSCNRERPRQEWIELPVPAIIDQETFGVAEERLEQNKRFSTRRTIEPTLLQRMLVCGECGYAYYRTSTRTSKGKIYYYRCLGSDDYRYANGRLCHNKPIRQDYLDGVVWQQIISLLEDPELIRQEIQRRLQEIQNSNPTKKRKEVLDKEITRQQKSIEKLLDAYQEGLLELDELRNRLPRLCKRAEALRSEFRSLEAVEVDRETYLRLANRIENFLDRLRRNSERLDLADRQKILRLVVKEILVYKETIKVKHSIPLGWTAPSREPGEEDASSYLLRSGSHITGSCQYLSPLQPGSLV